MARASVCDVNGATSQSCKVTRAIQNVHDQAEPSRRWPAVETYYARSNSRLFRSLKFLTPGTSDIIPAASPSLEIFGHFQASVWPCSCYFDVGLSPWNSTLNTNDFGVQFSINSWPGVHARQQPRQMFSHKSLQVGIEGISLHICLHCTDHKRHAADCF